MQPAFVTCSVRKFPCPALSVLESGDSHNRRPAISLQFLIRDLPLAIRTGLLSTHCTALVAGALFHR